MQCSLQSWGFTGGAELLRHKRRQRGNECQDGHASEREGPVRSMGPSGPLPDDGLSWQCLAPALCQSEYYLVLSRCPNLRGNVIGLESVSEIWRRRG
jgi:hypothetical protein